MPDEQVIELSIEETNKLRAKLGLKPLRVPQQQEQKSQQQSEQVLELSISETNALRAKLGLKPLQTTDANGGTNDNNNDDKIQHAPAIHEGQLRETQERIEKAKLKRQVDEGLRDFQSQPSLGSQSQSAKSWAQQMRLDKNKKDNDNASKTKSAKTPNNAQSYTESDLKGLNVGHSMSELQDGTTTVLTLADTAILNEEGMVNQDEAELENVNLSEAQKVHEGLKAKRQYEMGLGRTGGYAGYDDEEFVELGGTMAPSRTARGSMMTIDQQQQHSKKNNKKVKRGFQIGANYDEQDEQQESDLFTSKAISLEPQQADVTASDFMTIEEDEATRNRKKKDVKFKKKKKKDKKKKSSKKKQQRQTTESDDDDDDDDRPQIIQKGSKGLLEELEATAVENTTTTSRKRQREEEEEGTQTQSSTNIDKTKDMRSKYDRVMAKGNERSRQAFGLSQPSAVSSINAGKDDEEPDDAFLNAALAKARRLQRLKEMAEAKGATAVVQAVQQASSNNKEESTPEGGKSFDVDETREFTRALQARMEQSERTKKKSKVKEEEKETTKPEPMEIDEDKKPIISTVVKKENNQEEEDEEEEVDMNELAKQVKEEEVLDGMTGQTVRIGRGVGNVLNLLKQTGEITRKNAGREELRGRAKDERNYEDYQPVDLSKVVRIDERNATDKDRELAKREVKLEYRDKFGRLLTRKEAFRDLSYQFHGYGSGKRKEEKKLQQIAREQAEARLASRQTSSEGAGAGIFGALKETQKATGKAFVVHKTGN